MSVRGRGSIVSDLGGKVIANITLVEVICDLDGGHILAPLQREKQRELTSKGTSLLIMS